MSSIYTSMMALLMLYFEKKQPIDLKKAPKTSHAMLRVRYNRSTNCIALGSGLEPRGEKLAICLLTACH